MKKTTLFIGFLLSVVIPAASYAADCNGNGVPDDHFLFQSNKSAQGGSKDLDCR